MLKAKAKHGIFNVHAIAVKSNSNRFPAPGFLFHNRHPAALFMGNSGALALGAFLGCAGMLTGEFLPLATATAVFASEAGSVVLQVW